MGIVLYGAGKRGRKIEDLLYMNGIVIEGFVDSYKTGYVDCESGRRYSVKGISEVLRGGDSIIVTIADQKVNCEITEKLKNNGIDVVIVENILNKATDIVEKNRLYVAEYHVREMDDYFVEAEKDEKISLFWGPDSKFVDFFQRLALDQVIELACGRGRHVPHYVESAKSVTLVDILEKNIEYCRERFKENQKIVYYKNNGYDLHDLPSESYTALFTYDAMVHFEMLDIFNYLKETQRVLKNGGRALFHHSNNSSDYRVTFSSGTSGRNYMSKDLFAYLANRAGLKILEQRVFDWDDVQDLDCLSLVEKN